MAVGCWAFRYLVGLLLTFDHLWLCVDAQGHSLLWWFFAICFLMAASRFCMPLICWGHCLINFNWTVSCWLVVLLSHLDIVLSLSLCLLSVVGASRTDSDVFPVVCISVDSLLKHRYMKSNDIFSETVFYKVQQIFRCLIHRVDFGLQSSNGIM